MSSSSLPAFRLSPQQRQLWAIHGPDTSVYRACLELSITGPVDSQLLRNAVRRVVERHEILRTYFELQPAMKTPVQVVRPEAEFVWRENDLESVVALQEPPLCAALTRLSPQHHVLRVSLPSLCADSLTMRKLAAELSSAYGAENHDRAFQYADFSEWQYQLLDARDEDAEAGRRYWSEHATPAARLTLPFESGESQPDSTPARVSFLLPPELLAAVEQTAERARVSVADFLLACWQVLLWRYADEPQFAVAAVVDGRKFEDLQTGFGPYSRALPIAFNFREGMSFGDVLIETQRALREAQEWQEYFVPQDTEVPAVGYEFHDGSKILHAGPLEFRVSACNVWSYPFKLELACWRSERELDGDVYFAPDSIDAQSVERFVANLQTLLSSVATNLDAPLDQLSLLSRTERQQLADLNETSAELPRLSVVERFESQVQLTPSRTAVVFKDQRLTYEQLNSKANQVAHYLRGLGVGPDVAVALCVDRSVEMLIGMLGILKAGGAYVPLNPEHPAARLSFQIAEAGASIVLTNLASKPALDNPALKIVTLDSPPAEFQAGPSSNPDVAIGLDSLCYVIYTSGSTGNPKGVAVTHGGLANYNEFIVKKLATAENRPLHFATVSTFTADLGNTSIFPCLTSGGCLHVIPFAVVTDGRSFAAYNESQPLDVLKIVPSHFEALLAAAENVLPREFLIFGGEALSPQLLKRLRDEPTQCRIINHYGPTETTVGSLTFDCAEFAEQKLSAASVPIGGPIANTQAYILDRELNPAPFTVAGDLYLAGAGVARGYINQPATTADRFIPNPFSRTPGARMYRTGDRARYLANGRIEFLGRSDRQLKIRGFRIEPNEIETMLGQHPAIQRCVVAPLQRADGEPRLVAYIVSAQILTADELRAWLRSKLPDYLIPSQFINLKVLPLTRNGKVDYAALAEIAEHESLTGRPMVAPRTELEEKLAAMWCELLKLEVVGVTDNFFELGGHSLLVTQVVSRIRKFFCVELSLPDFFEGPTIEQLALKVETAKAEHTNRLLRQLEHMSDEDAQRLLKADS